MPLIPSGPFGTSAGFSEYDKDQQTQALTRHTDVMSQLGTAQIGEIQQKQADEARMLQVMSGVGAPPADGQQAPTTTQSLLDRVEGISARLMNAGFYKAGGDMATKASQMRAHDAQIRADQSREKFATMDHQEKAIGQLNSILVGIDGPESFVAAKDAWKQEHPDDPIPAQFDHYDPRIIDALRHGTKVGMEQLKAQREELRQQDLEASREERLKETRFRDLIAERRVADQERRTDRLLKEGGTKVPIATAPTKAMTDQANGMILEEFPNLKDTKAGFAVASDAKARMSTNGGISAEEALQQAYTAAKANGDFVTSTSEPTKIGGFEVPYTGGSKTTSYVGGGKTPETALSDPGDGKRRAGRYYTNAKGQVGKWTGKGVEVYSGPRSGTSVPARSSTTATSDPNEDLGIE